MVVLRATRKVLRSLPPPDPVSAKSGGALGDWYANRLVVDRRPLLVLVSSESLLAILISGREVRTLPDRLARVVADRLERLRIDRFVIEAEVTTMAPVRVGGTVDRSVVGSLVEFTRAVPHYLPIKEWNDTTLSFVEARLGETPCRVTGRMEMTLWPAQGARKLLTDRWASPTA